MIEGDETTLKSILEEKNELKLKLGSNLSELSDYQLNDDDSDKDKLDSDIDENIDGHNKKRKRK
jgi:hypothetical protein